MRTLAPHVHPHLRLQNLRQAEDRHRVRAADPNELRGLVSGRYFHRVFALLFARRRPYAGRARERTKPNAEPMKAKPDPSVGTRGTCITKRSHSPEDSQRGARRRPRPRAVGRCPLWG